MVVTASKTSKSYIINIFHLQLSNFTFLHQERRTKSSNKHNIQHNELSKSYYSSEDSKEYIAHLLRIRL